jgi:DNA polymerase-3 subunit beta
MEQTALMPELAPVADAGAAASATGATEFSVNNQELLKELSNLQRIVPRKTTIPILLNLHIQAAGNAIFLTASDADVSLRTVCSAKVKKEGRLTVPAHKFYDYVRLLEDGNVTMRLHENHSVQIRSGRSHTKMVGLAAESFPKLPLFPANSAVKLDTEAVRTLITRTLFAICTEESRYLLNGALLLLKPEGLTMVSTDGHRMAHVEYRKLQEAKESSVLIPKKALVELGALLNCTSANQIQFAQDESTLYFAVGSRLLTCRQLSGRFPNYEAVMPKDLSHKATVSREELLLALQRVAQFADEKSNGVRVRIAKKEFKLASSNGATGESEDVLETDYASEEKVIAFNSQYLLDFLRIVDCERVRLEFKDRESASEFRPDDDREKGCAYRYIVMPLRM